MPRKLVHPEIANTHEERVSKALQDLHDNPNAYISHVAKAHGICSETLSRRLRGKTKSKRQAHEVDQMFTRPQELELVSWVQDQAVYPQQHELRARALEYLEELGDPKPKLDDHWVTRFVRRHPDLETKRKSSIAAKKKKVRQERKANVMEDGSMGDGS